MFIGLCRNSEKGIERIKWSFFKNPALLSDLRILVEILLEANPSVLDKQKKSFTIC
jgi:hypothetical protein